jgi:hypothetical protein
MAHPVDEDVRRDVGESDRDGQEHAKHGREQPETEGAELVHRDARAVWRTTARARRLWFWARRPALSPVRTASPSLFFVARFLIRMIISLSGFV